MGKAREGTAKIRPQQDKRMGTNEYRRDAIENCLIRLSPFACLSAKLTPRTQRLEGAQRGGAARLHAEFRENLQQMFFDRGFTDAENRGNVRVGLALSHPEQDLRDARR